MKKVFESFTQIKTFSITTKDFLSKNNYSGNGNIEISSKDSSVILKCNGKWRDKHNNISSFTFSYRFIFENELNEVSIEHMRYGEESPVYLSKLKQNKLGSFVSEEPHICNEDLYSAELFIKENIIHLTWKITGPKKNLILKYKLRG